MAGLLAGGEESGGLSGLLREFLKNDGLAGLLGMGPSVASRMTDYDRMQRERFAQGERGPAMPDSPEAQAGMDLAGDFNFVGGIKNAGLDMSQAARMARAQEMGFDTEQPVYHGTDKSIKAFSLKKANPRSNTLGEAVYVTPNSSLANNFADNGRDGGNILKMLARTERPFDVSIGNAMSLLDQYPLLVNEMRVAAGQPELPQNVLQRHAQIQRDKLLAAKSTSPRAERMALQDFVDEQQPLIRQAHDAVRWGDETAVFSPAQVRSVHAAFDPAKRDSADLLASIAGAGLLGAGMYGGDY